MAGLLRMELSWRCDNFYYSTLKITLIWMELHPPGTERQLRLIPLVKISCCRHLLDWVHPSTRTVAFWFYSSHHKTSTETQKKGCPFVWISLFFLYRLSSFRRSHFEPFAAKSINEKKLSIHSLGWVLDFEMHSKYHRTIDFSQWFFSAVGK